MFTRRTILAGAIALLASGAYAQDSETPQEDESVIEVGGASAATDLADSTRCSAIKPGVGLAELTWTLASAPGAEQRIDVTEFRDGFETGKFSTIGPLDGNDTSVRFEGLTAGINYYWRVLTRTDGGWVASETARCQAPICPVDGSPPR